jgi:acetylornithine/N-succinyldiaminopimelate aminotransferase
MIGFDLPDELANLRKDLLFKHAIFTGEAKPNTVRLLPSLALSKAEAEMFLEALAVQLKQTVAS